MCIYASISVYINIFFVTCMWKTKETGQSKQLGTSDFIVHQSTLHSLTVLHNRRFKYDHLMEGAMELNAVMFFTAQFCTNLCRVTIR